MTEREKTALKALHERAERSGKRAKIYENYAAKELARALFPLYSADSDEEAFSEAFRDAVSSCGVRNPFFAALAVAKIFEEKRTPLFYSEELHFTRPEKEKILLVKSRFSEEALEKSGLSGEFYYAEDFEECCEAVADRQKTGCFLPFSDSNGQPMPGIARLVSENGLKKQKVFLLENEGQKAGYALFVKDLTVDAQADHLEVGLYPEGTLSLSGLLELSEILGVSVSLNVQPSEESTGKHKSWQILLQGETEKLKEALFSLGLFCPTLSLNGFYTRQKI